MEKDEFFLKRIRELANISYQRDIVTFSDFLTLNEQNMINSRISRMPGVVMEAFGGYEHAERQMVAFHPDALVFPWEYPIDCLEDRTKGSEVFGKADAQRLLGSAAKSWCGPQRDRRHSGTGGCCLVFLSEENVGLFLENLCRVRHTGILLTKVENPEELPKPRLEPVKGTCASVRLDSLIALAFRESRSSMVSYIEGGLVFVNGKLITSNGYEPKEGDIVSVRGKGRFRYEGISGQTRKGRLSVCIMRYI